MPAYKTLTIGFGEGDHAEDHTYVVEDAVTAAQILQGDDTGVVCLCIQPEMAPKIASMLNEPVTA